MLKMVFALSILLDLLIIHYTERQKLYLYIF